ncbi:hypothetical protein HYU10_00335 [Candidatus Woesearchaeota archaeon]|nr:hypothetical protein [Candidatus Woesearchaeota archaeon]
MKVQLGFNMHTFLLILLFVVAIKAIENYNENTYTIIGDEGSYTYNSLTGLVIAETPQTRDIIGGNNPEDAAGN